MYGSEHGGGWNKTHGRVDKHLCLDSLTLLKNWPDGAAQEIRWGSGKAIVGKLDGDHFILAYAPKDCEPVRQTIGLSRISNGYGGKPRTYFLCPICGKRVQKLYFKDKRFRCRICAGLNYYSQQITHNEQEAAWKMERIFRKDFGVTGELAPVDMCHWVPDKPKWMRCETYGKNVAKLRKAQEAYNQAFIASASRILGKGWR